jgi:hypothetical protein
MPISFTHECSTLMTVIPDLTEHEAATRALSIDPDQLRAAAADAKALAIEALVRSTSPGRAAERIGTTAQGISNARARVTEIQLADPKERAARLRRAAELVERLGI